MKARKKKMDRLTRDVIAAQRAGVSYGQYKVMHPYTGDAELELPEPEPEIEEPETIAPYRICQHCGGQFSRDNKRGKKFCSIACQHAARNERRKRERAARKN